MNRTWSIYEFVSSPMWMKAFIYIFIISVIVFTANHFIDEVRPGNFWGLTYGTIAAVLFFAVAAYGFRRRTMKTSSKMKLGRSYIWLQFHLYGGALSLLFMFMHINFQFPQGAFNWWLWGLTVWVVLSGIVGVVLQKWIPRLMSSALTLEVRYDRIPELVAELAEKARAEAAGASEPIQDFYNRTMAADMEKPLVRPSFFIDITGGVQARIRQMDYLKQFLSPEEEDKLEKLEMLFRTKLECDAHYTLQKPLRVWLVTHLPVSIVLLVLLLIHLFIVYYY
ncbi:MAG: hypothetical protein IIA17_06100 [candidate division Zixibacteria bacterium]|nr:hypothetical protein [candidate division Zixibacteria bacterium]